MNISPFSIRSLLLYPKMALAGGIEQKLSSATGFLVEYEAKHFLITNWHVLAGRNTITGQPLADHCGTPDRVEVWYNQIGLTYESWIPITEPVVDEFGSPRWLEHPRYGRSVDVVALPLKVASEDCVGFTTHNLYEEPPVLAADVPDAVYIIGFPFGITIAGKIAIWVRGSIATDIDLDFDELPCFLVDSRTRQGQSGSPVLAYKTRSEAALATDGDVYEGHDGMSRLLGVYSGRISVESDLGRVWKTSTILEILEHGVYGNVNLPST